MPIVTFTNNSIMEVIEVEECNKARQELVGYHQMDCNLLRAAAFGLIP